MGDAELTRQALSFAVMADEIDVDALLHSAAELNARRTAALRAWYEAHGRTAAARADLEAAKAAEDGCYVALVPAGWTASELKKLNVRPPVKANGDRRSKSRAPRRSRSSAQPAAGVEQASASGDATSDEDETGQ